MSRWGVQQALLVRMLPQNKACMLSGAGLQPHHYKVDLLLIRLQPGSQSAAQSSASIGVMMLPYPRPYP